MKTTLLKIVCALSIICFTARADDSTALAEKTKPCFQCNGTGKMKCPAQVDCPGKCLKLNKGTWVHMEVAGHPPTDVWQKFTTPAGGWTAYNQNHVGHIIQLQNGDFKDVGSCPICKGTTKVKCPVCNGTGEAVCSLCEGKKVVPISWTEFDNPKMKTHPEHFKLKNGTVLVGKQVIIMGDRTTIRTAKEDVEVNTADIVPDTKPAAAAPK